MKLPHTLSAKALKQLYQSKGQWEKARYGVWIMNTQNEYNPALEAKYLVNIYEERKIFYVQALK
jgi:hypothetical protein